MGLRSPNRSPRSTKDTDARPITVAIWVLLMIALGAGLYAALMFLSLN